MAVEIFMPYNMKIRGRNKGSVINGRRSILNGSDNVTQQDEPDARMLRILSWKAERKTVNLMKKKRPFLTGVIHHKHRFTA